VILAAGGKGVEGVGRTCQKEGHARGFLRWIDPVEGKSDQNVIMMSLRLTNRHVLACRYPVGTSPRSRKDQQSASQPLSAFKQMLTLDPITLFFYNLSQSSEGHRDASKHHEVASWANSVHSNIKTKGTKQSTSTPSLTSRSQYSSISSSLASSRSALNGNIGVKVTQDEDNDDGALGLSDYDEMQGEERDEAKQSPVKPQRSRVSNRVCHFFFLFDIALSVSLGNRCRQAPRPAEERESAA
jgi:hypothetical protein